MFWCIFAFNTLNDMATTVLIRGHFFISCFYYFLRFNVRADVNLNLNLNPHSEQVFVRGYPGAKIDYIKGGKVMVFNTTFNNISVILWQSVLLVEETGVPIEDHWSCEFESCSWRDLLNTTLCDKVCQWLTTGRWFSPGTPVSSTNKTGRHDIAEILLKVALNTIKQTESIEQGCWQV